MIIFLIGMPACGKSRIGRHLANKLQVKFLDLDKHIVSTEQNTITQIFSLRGEHHFRKLETKYLSEIISISVNSVVSVGGGAPCFNNNMSLMLSSGKVVYLNTPLEILEKRLQSNQKRPMFKGLSEQGVRQKLQKVQSEREECYLRAHYKIDTDKKSDAAILDEIFLLINQ